MGNAAISIPVLAPSIERAPKNGSSHLSDTLTSRELQVLRLMAEGMSTKQIGVSLNITFKTAASHRSHILTKLGVHETVTAVRMAIRSGYIEP
jgi:DNA-binding NarL/FixJ family response regulator